MQTYIALLRGINVGGRNRLSMSDLRSVLEALGAENIRTYIQSGNLAFQHQEDLTDQFADEIGALIFERHGFTPFTLLLALEELENAISSNPYPEAEPDPKSLHLFFLASKPQEPDVDALEEARAETERFRLIGKVLYLHAPEGIGKSKLAARIERALGEAATGRNWRSVEKILAMARER